MARQRDRDVYQRGGKWWGVIPRDDGEAERRSLRLSASAPRTEAIARWLDVARVQRSADKTAHTPRVGALFDSYVAEQKRRGRSEATREIDDTKAGHFVRLWGATTPTHNITASLVAKYIEQREEEGAKPRTILRELVVLRGALKLAIHLGTFTTPLERVMPLDYAPKYVPRKRWLSWEVAHQVFDELTEDQHRGWFAYTLGAGTRKSETEKARLSYIEEDWVYVDGTKTPESDNAVPITAFQRPWLELAKKYGAKQGAAFGVWTNVLRGLRRATDRLSTCASCRKNGRGTPSKNCLGCRRTPRIEPVTPNDLRRTLGFWLRDGGVSPDLIGKVLRHTDSRMAELVYAKGSPTGTLALLEVQIQAAGGAPKTVRQTVRNALNQTVPERSQRHEKRKKTG